MVGLIIIITVYALAFKLQLIILIFVNICARTIVSIFVIVASERVLLFLFRSRVLIILNLGSSLAQTIANVLRGID